MTPTTNATTNPITPYLIFDGDCRDAMALYQRCLGGRVEAMTYADGGHAASPETADWVMHACLVNGPLRLMASDRHPGVPYERGHAMHVMLECDSAEAVERTYAALAEGGESTMPPHDTFWGARFGMLVDRFRTQWMLSHMRAADCAERATAEAAGAAAGAAAGTMTGAA